MVLTDSNKNYDYGNTNVSYLMKYVPLNFFLINSITKHQSNYSSFHGDHAVHVAMVTCCSSFHGDHAAGKKIRDTLWPIKTFAFQGNPFLFVMLLWYCSF